MLLRLSGPTTWTPDDVVAVLDFLCQVGRPFRTRPWTRPSLRDADDEFVLELSVASAADHLVTSNVRDFEDVGRYGATVVTPAQFLRIAGGT